MNRVFLSLVIVGLIVAAAGCRTCISNYDYCGPLFTGECGGVPCDPCARAGSILSPSLPIPGQGMMIEGDGMIVQGEGVIMESEMPSETIESETFRSLPRDEGYDEPVGPVDSGAYRQVRPPAQAHYPKVQYPQSAQQYVGSVPRSTEHIPSGAVILSETDRVVSESDSNFHSNSRYEPRPVRQASGWKTMPARR